MWSDGAGAELSYVRNSSFPLFFLSSWSLWGGEGRDLALGFRIFRIFRIICFCLLYLTFRSSFGIGFVFWVNYWVVSWWETVIGDWVGVRVRESQDLSIYYYYLGVNDGDHVNSVYFCWYWSNVFIAPVFAGICRCGRSYTNFCLCNFLIDP